MNIIISIFINYIFNNNFISIFIDITNIPTPLQSRIIRLAAFQNPDFYKAQAMRMSTFGKPRVISCAEYYSQHIALPRGCQDELISLFDELKIKMELMNANINKILHVLTSIVENPLLEKVEQNGSPSAAL